MRQPIRVLFVCTGNICRSPLAEAVFAHLVKQAGLTAQFELASAGTGTWHIGEPPYTGTQNVLRTHQIPLRPEKRAQQIKPADLHSNQYILVADQLNLDDMAWMRAANQGEIRRLLEFASPGTPLDLPDPYYTRDFEQVYELVLQACQNLLVYIREKEGL